MGAMKLVHPRRTAGGQERGNFCSGGLGYSVIMFTMKGMIETKLRIYFVVMNVKAFSTKSQYFWVNDLLLEVIISIITLVETRQKQIIELHWTISVHFPKFFKLFCLLVYIGFTANSTHSLVSVLTRRHSLPGGSFDG